MIPQSTKLCFGLAILLGILYVERADAYEKTKQEIDKTTSNILGFCAWLSWGFANGFLIAEAFRRYPLW